MAICLRSLLETSWQSACFDGKNRVLVSASGGADSMALLAALIAGSWRVRVAHVNFGLRGDESDGDEMFLRDFCAARGLVFLCRRVSAAERTARQGESVQEWARRLRREWLLSVREPDEVIALGHHRDDLIETIMMRLLRGTSGRHLLGMEEYRAPWWRPFLGVTRDEIRTWLRGQELPHREDQSNATLDYSRNVLRNSIFPQLEQLFPGCSRRLLSLAEECRDLAEGVRAQLPGFSEGIPRAWLRQQPKSMGLTAIASLLEDGKHRLLSRLFLETVWENAVGTLAHWAAEVPGGGRLEIKGQNVIFVPLMVQSFSDRRRQHAKGLQGQRLRAILTEGAQVTFPGANGVYEGGPDPTWIEHVTP